LLKIYTQRNCKGISLKTQFLYLLVFLCRYLDIFWNFGSIYNEIMKLIFITSSAIIVYLMKFVEPYASTYESKVDSLNILFIILPCMLLALVVNDYFTATEILWTFSIYLEAVAILPQLVVVHEYARNQNGFVENLTSNYVVALGAYRALYIINWIYRFATEPGYSAWIVWVAGFIQTMIYVDFFYYFAKAQFKGEKMSLPI